MARILVFGKEHFQRYFQDQSMVKWEHNRAALPSFEKESYPRTLSGSKVCQCTSCAKPAFISEKVLLVVLKMELKRCHILIKMVCDHETEQSGVNAMVLCEKKPHETKAN